MKWRENEEMGRGGEMEIVSIMWRLCFVIQVMLNLFKLWFALSNCVFFTRKHVWEKKHFETEVCWRNWKVREVDPIYQSYDPLPHQNFRAGATDEWVGGFREGGFASVYWTFFFIVSQYISSIMNIFSLSLNRLPVYRTCFHSFLIYCQYTEHLMPTLCRLWNAHIVWH